MPDPRPPQRPGSRQPSPQPNKGPEKPSPRSNISRPIRTVDPSQQPPPLTSERKLRKGEIYWVMGSVELPEARRGTIIRLSNEPGRTIGVEFEEPIGGVDEDGETWGVNHDCAGHGKVGHCLYVGAEQLLDDKAMEAHKARMAGSGGGAAKHDEYDELTVGPESSQPRVPDDEDE